MRFIVFFNHHPKINDYQVRTWDNATSFARHKGEMTHPEFIRYCQIDFQDVQLLGDIIYHSASQKWIFDTKKASIFLGKDKKQKEVYKALVLDYVNAHYEADEKAIQQSLKEQQQRQLLSSLKKLACR